MRSDWERSTKNRVFKTLSTLVKSLSAIYKRNVVTVDAYKVAAVALAVAKDLDIAADELRHCAADLGYKSETEGDHHE